MSERKGLLGNVLVQRSGNGKICPGQSIMSSEVADREERLLYIRGPGGTRHRESNVTFPEGQKPKKKQ